MAQQTAVDWLVEQYANENYGIEVYEQAKQMEKKQIIKAHNDGDVWSGEQYYTETYGK